MRSLIFLILFIMTAASAYSFDSCSTKDLCYNQEGKPYCGPADASCTFKSFETSSDICVISSVEADSDSDGWSDSCDALPKEPTEWVDLDADGYGHNIDCDDLDPEVGPCQIDGDDSEGSDDDGSDDNIDDANNEEADDDEDDQDNDEGDDGSESDKDALDEDILDPNQANGHNSKSGRHCWHEWVCSYSDCIDGKKERLWCEYTGNCADEADGYPPRFASCTPELASPDIPSEEPAPGYIEEENSQRVELQMIEDKEEMKLDMSLILAAAIAAGITLMNNALFRTRYF